MIGRDSLEFRHSIAIIYHSLCCATCFEIRNIELEEADQSAMAPCDVENGSASATTPLLDVPGHTGVAEEPAQAVRIGGLAKQFGWLGWAAFGGPSAHVSLFQKVPQRAQSQRP